MAVVDNQKYLDYQFIIPKVSRAVKELGIIVIKEDIAEWCSECEIDYIAQEQWMVKYIRIPLRVINGYAKLPCNVYRILDVYNGYSWINYETDGSFIKLHPSYNHPYIFINFWGIPINEEGIPYILKGHEQACEAFCIWKLVYPFWIAGKMQAQIYKDIEDRLDIQVQAAKNGYRHKDRETVNHMMMIFGNMVPKIGSLTLYHQAFVDFGEGSLESVQGIGTSPREETFTDEENNANTHCNTSKTKEEMICVKVENVTYGIGREQFIATQDQVSFTVKDSIKLNSNCMLIRRGSMQDSSSYTIQGQVITLLVPCDEGDVIIVIN